MISNKFSSYLQRMSFCLKLAVPFVNIILVSIFPEINCSSGEYPTPYHQTKQEYELCNTTIHLQPNDKGVISSPGYPSKYPANIYCEYTLSILASDQRIKLTFQDQFDLQDSFECRQDYLHIGNNLNFKNMKSLTSYKLCGNDTPPEIVSRGNAMWIIFSSDSQGINYGFSLTYEVLPVVHCKNSTDLACSEVQCVNREQVCDGNQDCTNHLDEYCGFSGSYSESCFLCTDHSCILPKQPLSSMEYGKKWWWLCDDWSHCEDGTDERMDICIPLEARSDAIFECKAALSIHANHTIALLTPFLCDGINHCLYGEDENHPRCQRNSEGSKFDKRIILFPLLAIVIFSIFMIFVYNLGKCRRFLNLPRSVSITKRCRFSDRSDPPNLIEGHHKPFTSAYMDQGPDSNSCTDSKQTFV